MAKPVALAGAAIVRDHSILPATLISLSGAGIDPDGDPITAYQWTLLDRPPGSVAALVDDTTDTPDLTPDLPGTYLCFLEVQAGGEWSEAHGPLAPDSAYCAVVVTTRYQALRIPGAGERAWAPHLYDALLKIDTLAGLIGAAVSPVVTKRDGDVIAIPSVAPGGSEVVDVTSFLDDGAVLYLKLTAAAATLATTLEIYGRDTYLAADRRYQAGDFDCWSAPYEDAVPFYYRDVDGSGELHVQVINNGGVASEYTLEVVGIGG
jgi:hypothetical protein